MIGEKILHYEITEEIVGGEGGTGKVYKGIDTTSGEECAIKVILPSLANNEMARDRFNQEAQILSKFDHKNIVKIKQYHPDERGVFLILEYVEGEPLDKYLRKMSAVDIDFVIKVSEQVLDGLIYAHGKNIIHRDIKPSNILIDKNGTVKIIDFGLAKMMDSDENLAKTMVEQNLGTPRYMSPEQIKGEELTHLTDIYSFGLVLYEMLTNRVIYGNESNIFQLQTKIVNEELPPASRINKDVSSKLDNILNTCLAKNPRNRYSDCKELQDWLLDKTVRVPPLQNVTIHVDVKNADHASIVVGDQGSVGSKASFSLPPLRSYRLSVMAPGMKEVKKEISLESTDDGKNYDIELTPLKSKGLSDIGKFILFLCVVLSLALIYLIVSNSDLNKTNDKLQKEVEYYESIQ